MKVRSNILLIGDNFRSILAVARVFKENDFDIHVLGFWNLPLQKSKYISNYYNFDIFQKNLLLFKSFFFTLLKKNDFKFCLPINDEAILIINEFSKEIKRYTTIIGIQEPGIMNFAINKNALVEKFNELKLPTPKTKIICNSEDLTQYHHSVFPVIIKPASSKVIKGNQLKTYNVSIVRSQKEFDQFLNTDIPMLVQEYIPGKEMGFNFYADKGKIISYYIDEMLHTVSGREASYRRFAKITPEDAKTIFNTFELFIKSIEWNGLGMFDFKFFENKAYVIELNGRFWASLELCRKLGPDLVQLFIDRKIHKSNHEFNTPINPQGSIRFLSEDILYAIDLLKRLEFVKFGYWMASLIYLFRKDEIIEDSILSDAEFKINLLSWRIKNLFRKILKHK